MISQTSTQPTVSKPKPGDSYDLIIIGSGPAGMSAAICAGRARLKTLVIEKAVPGGEASISFQIDNYIGFPNGILGEELSNRMEAHMHNYPIDYTCETVEAIDQINQPVKMVRTDLGQIYKARTILLAVGLEPKRLNMPYERTFFGRGISYFAQCDADSYSGTNIAVIGGGNCASYAADYLSRFSNTVYLVHRSDQLKAVDQLKDKILNNPNVTLMWNSELTEVFGIDKVEKMKVTHVITGQHTWIDVKGIFIYAGRIPPDTLFALPLQRDEKGYIVTDELMRTSIAGIYAAGDIRSKQIRQIATAVSDGMIAAINIGREIQDGTR
jgi:thioredoxin reductase (NADPH)